MTCNEEDGDESTAARLDPSLGLQSAVGGCSFSSRVPSSLNASNSCPSLRIHHAEKAVLPFVFLLSTLAGLIFHHAPVFSGIISLDSWPFATPVGTRRGQHGGANKITRPDLGTARIHPIKFFLPQVRTQLAPEDNAARSTHVCRDVWIAVCFGEPCPLNSRLFVRYPYFDI